MPLQRPYSGPQAGAAPVIQVNPDQVSATVYPFTYFGSTGDDGASINTALLTYNVVYLASLAYVITTTPSLLAGQVVYAQPGTTFSGAGTSTFATTLTSVSAQAGSGLPMVRTSALGATFPRYAATVATAAVTTSGTVYLTAITLPGGTTVTNIVTMTGTGTLKTGGTHGWYIICDSARKVRGATADQTDAATVWGTASTEYSIALSAPYVTTYSGLYYIGIMVANSAGSQPNLIASATQAAGITGAAPILCGATATTGQTTPPATDGSVTIGAITADGTKNFLFWIT